MLKSLGKLKKIDLKKIKIEDVESNFRKILYSPYLYLGLGLFVGLLFTVQFKNESQRPLSPILFYNQLTDTRNEYNAKRDELNAQAKDLQKQIAAKEKMLTDKNVISSSLLNSETEQEMIFGSTALTGEGVEIVVSDGSNQIKDEYSKSLTHAADLRDVVNLLWYAGAEAVSINDERVIYNTSIDCIVSTIMINSNNYVPPFTIKAIGNKDDLYNVINSSRKLVDIKKRADKKQIDFGINKNNNIRIEKYSGAAAKT